MDEFSRYFPNLSGSGWIKTSEADPRYNCFAWAAGQTKVRWDFIDGDWPDGCERRQNLESILCVFQSVGFERCNSDKPESGYEKIAIFCLDNGVPQHASRQLPSGRWTSTLGFDIDIEHSLEGLSGGIYGTVKQILRRPLPGQ
jgi:hypothetical protein